MPDPEERSSDREKGRGQRGEKKSGSRPSAPLPSSLTSVPNVVLACITTATFTDLVAYSVAVPVLPDYATRFNASPTIDRVAVRVVRRHAARAVDSDGRPLRSHRPQGPDDRRARAAGGSTLAFAYAAVAADAVRRAAAAGRRRRHDVDRRLRDDRRSLRPGRARPRDGARDGRQHARHHHRAGPRRMAVRDRRHPPAVPVRRGHGGRRFDRVCARSRRARTAPARRRRCGAC